MFCQAKSQFSSVFPFHLFGLCSKHSLKLSRLFKKVPGVQSQFKGFADKSLEELKVSKRFAAHGTTVLKTIDSYIENLDDIEVVLAMLETLGINHKNRGIPTKYFDVSLLCFWPFFTASPLPR